MQYGVIWTVYDEPGSWSTHPKHEYLVIDLDLGVEVARFAERTDAEREAEHLNRRATLDAHAARELSISPTANGERASPELAVWFFDALNEGRR